MSELLDDITRCSVCGQKIQTFDMIDARGSQWPAVSVKHGHIELCVRALGAAISDPQKRSAE